MVCIKETQELVTLPSNNSDWNKVLEDALSVTRYGQNEKSHKVVRRAGEKFSQTQRSIPCYVHCECSILHFFHTLSLSPPPLSYIGVSKLSCAACMSVFSAWKKLFPMNLYTCRGSHGKWYFPWAVPASWDSGLKYSDSARVLDAIYYEIADHSMDTLHELGLITRQINGRYAPSGTESPLTAKRVTGKVKALQCLSFD